MSVTSTLETITEESLSHSTLVRNLKMSAVLQSLCSPLCVSWFMKGRKGLLVVLGYLGNRVGSMNSAQYQDQVLDGVLKDFYSQVSKEESRIEFQQDGMASHHSKSTMQWFCRNQILLFYHLSCSPDLSPIEPVWLELKMHLQALPHLPPTVAQLIQAVKDIWDELPISDIDKHIDNMDRRVKAVFQAKGGHTLFSLYYVYMDCRCINIEL